MCRFLHLSSRLRYMRVNMRHMRQFITGGLTAGPTSRKDNGVLKGKLWLVPSWHHSPQGQSTVGMNKKQDVGSHCCGEMESLCTCPAAALRCHSVYSVRLRGWYLVGAWSHVRFWGRTCTVCIQAVCMTGRWYVEWVFFYSRSTRNSRNAIYLITAKAYSLSFGQ